ncbi:MAG: hypothetical protein ACPG8W_15745 [Candidatus Promineifilaceae bacterium]
MSEYQYYEFQAIDRPLTIEEQNEVASLSSRVDPHPRQAVFVYHFGNFRGNELDVLARYYDAFFYIANWGTTRLVFRLPADVVDEKLLRRYEADEFVVIHNRDKYLLVEFRIHDENGYGWTEGEGSLSGLLGLRDALLNQDYRIMYLGWLLGVASEWLYEDLQEPPVPAGLGQLDTALRNFVKTFEVDNTLISAAAQASSKIGANQSGGWEQAIEKLSAAEQKAWLMRLAEGELLLSLRFQQQLAKSSPKARHAIRKPRTVSKLLAQAKMASRIADRLAKRRASAK